MNQYHNSLNRVIFSFQWWPNKQTMRIIFLTLLLILPVAILPQTLVIEGKIKDANTHREIPGVTITIEELDVQTYTNPTGYFQFTVVKPEPEMLVTFQHVAYDTLQLSIEDVLTRKTIYLQERVIPIPPVTVQPIEDQLEIASDLPQTVSVIDARIFDLRGFLDAGDLLLSDHSIQVDEDISGKKTVSIRGGNPDEVMVLYNGIEMNSPLDNIYDISLIDLADVSRFEVIKGSNTALYGPEAFSGVINVVPKAQQDYNIRFQQQLGTYQTDIKRLNLYRNFNRFHAAYNLKLNNWQRDYPEEPPGFRRLENSSEHHTASLAYNFSETPQGQPITSLGILYVRSLLDYQNHRVDESVNNANNMISARFTGHMGELRNLTITGAYQWLDENQTLRFFDSPTRPGNLNRSISDDSWHLQVQKGFKFNHLEFLGGYQVQNFRLNFTDVRTPLGKEAPSLEEARLERRHYGLVGIAKFIPPQQLSLLRHFQFNLSSRYDKVVDFQAQPRLENTSKLALANFQGIVPKNTWEETSYKFATYISGNTGRSAYNAFFNIGTNVKFPTLLQQISTRKILSPESGTTELLPEKNLSMEIGFQYTRAFPRAPGIYGWEFNANAFRNSYTNKVRSYFLPGTPIAVYDVVPSASMEGIETKQSIYFFRKKMTLEFGASRYYFSNPAIFSLRSNYKYILNVMIDQAGYSLQLFAFKEGKQVAQIRNPDGGFSQQTIPENTNINLYFSKAFDVKNIKLIVNASLQNLLDDTYQLAGLPLRDQRYYFTLGVQY
ncbi:MAG: TonB-dependent receptor [Calditrichaeota bacterium]|nr:MAG: TonB-dependent receptor [Calditrichota bacterium]